MDFPATKNEIVEYVKSNNADSNILERLQNIEDKEYQNSVEVATAAELTIYFFSIIKILFLLIK